MLDFALHRPFHRSLFAGGLLALLVPACGGSSGGASDRANAGAPSTGGDAGSGGTAGASTGSGGTAGASTGSGGTAGASAGGDAGSGGTAGAGAGGDAGSGTAGAGAGGAEPRGRVYFAANRTARTLADGATVSGPEVTIPPGEPGSYLALYNLPAVSWDSTAGARATVDYTLHVGSASAAHGAVSVTSNPLPNSVTRGTMVVAGDAAMTLRTTLTATVDSGAAPTLPLGAGASLALVRIGTAVGTNVAPLTATSPTAHSWTTPTLPVGDYLTFAQGTLASSGGGICGLGISVGGGPVTTLYASVPAEQTSQPVFVAATASLTGGAVTFETSVIPSSGATCAFSDLELWIVETAGRPQVSSTTFPATFPAAVLGEGLFLAQYHDNWATSDADANTVTIDGTAHALPFRQYERRFFTLLGVADGDLDVSANSSAFVNLAGARFDSL